MEEGEGEARVPDHDNARDPAFDRHHLARGQAVQLAGQAGAQPVLALAQALHQPGRLAARLGDDEGEVVAGPRFAVGPRVEHRHRLSRDRRRRRLGLTEAVPADLEHSGEIAQLDPTAGERAILDHHDNREELVEEGDVGGNDDEARDRRRDDFLDLGLREVEERRRRRLERARVDGRHRELGHVAPRHRELVVVGPVEQAQALWAEQEVEGHLDGAALDLEAHGVVPGGVVVAVDDDPVAVHLRGRQGTGGDGRDHEPVDDDLHLRRHRRRDGALAVKEADPRQRVAALAVEARDAEGVAWRRRQRQRLLEPGPAELSGDRQAGRDLPRAELAECGVDHGRAAGIDVLALGEDAQHRTADLEVAARQLFAPGPGNRPRDQQADRDPHRERRRAEHQLIPSSARGNALPGTGKLSAVRSVDSSRRSVGPLETPSP